MKKSLVMMALVFVATGCGALRISPKDCKTGAVWGDSKIEGKVVEVKSRDSYSVFSDQEVLIRDVLEDGGFLCSEVQSLKASISTSWFFSREVSLKIITK